MNGWNLTNYVGILTCYKTSLDFINSSESVDYFSRTMETKLEMCQCDTDSFVKGSKILNTSCLLKQPRQTVQTKIRLLLKKQSGRGLHFLLFCHAFYEFQS